MGVRSFRRALFLRNCVIHSHTNNMDDKCHFVVTEAKVFQVAISAFGAIS